MKALWLWFIGLFIPNKIPEEIIDETTAWVEPDNYIPGEIIDDYVPEADIDELEDINEPYVDPDERDPSKFAVLIGINKYDPSLNADLNGCVNDVENMYKVLTETYGFPHDNIRMLTDSRATSDNMYDRISWLLDHSVPGDELVLHYSGHGSQIRDRDTMDELNDYLDEILCPTDLDWDDPFTDDSIGEIFENQEEGVFLTFICDSCHSGSITRSIAPSNEVPPHMDEVHFPRFINPPLDIKSREGVDKLNVNKLAAINEQDKDMTTEMNHVLISGCRDDQTSSDAYIDGRWQGAMTSSLIKAIKRNANRDWTAIHADMISILNEKDFTQKPQLTGSDSLIKGRTIFGS